MKNLGRYNEDLSVPRKKDVDGKYTKPAGGIPKSDLSSSVQASLNKADSALQTAPVTSVNGKTGDVVIETIDDRFYIATMTGSGTNADPYVIDKEFDDVYDAVAQNKFVYVYSSNERAYYSVAAATSIFITFANNARSQARTIAYMTTGTVTYLNVSLEQTANKTDTITADSTTTQYPSAKAVWDLAGNLESGTKVTQYTGTLLASGWAADSYGYQAQTITISGLKASYDVDPEWDVALSGTDPDADAALLEGFALIHNYKTGANSLTAQCIGAAPTVNIPVKVVVFG